MAFYTCLDIHGWLPITVVDWYSCNLVWIFQKNDPSVLLWWSFLHLCRQGFFVKSWFLHSWITGCNFRDFQVSLFVGSWFTCRQHTSRTKSLCSKSISSWTWKRCNEGFSINSPKLNNTRTLTKTLLKSEDHSHQVFSFKALTNFKEAIVATTLLLVTQAMQGTLILKF